MSISPTGVAEPAGEVDSAHDAQGHQGGLAKLAVGAVGIVFGDCSAFLPVLMARARTFSASGAVVRAIA